MVRNYLTADYIALSDTGLVREQNEDAWMVLPEQGAYIVADGMGGANGGEVASNLAVEELTHHLVSYKSLNINDLQQIFQAVNETIYEKSQFEKNLSGMGTTLVLFLLQENEALFAYVGDSRIYLFRNAHLKQVSRDHSLVNELLDIGVINQEEAKNFPYKHILTKAMGTNPTLEASTGSLSVEKGDLFLLATDGLTNYLSDEKIEEILKGCVSLPDCGTLLVESAKKNGGGDNITLILLRIDDLSR